MPQPDDIPPAVQAVPGPDSTVYVYFADGAITRYDAAPLIHAGSAFEALSDPEVFRSALTVLDGAVAWDLGGSKDPTRVLDIAPEAVYASPRVQDPLSRV